MVEFMLRVNDPFDVSSPSAAKFNLFELLIVIVFWPLYYLSAQELMYSSSLIIGSFAISDTNYVILLLYLRDISSVLMRFLSKPVSD